MKLAIDERTWQFIGVLEPLMNSRVNYEFNFIIHNIYTIVSSKLGGMIASADVIHSLL